MTTTAVRELAPGLWHWQSRHPEWTPDQPWRPEVSSYALAEDGRLLLFDPLAVPDEIVDPAAGGEIAIVLTAPWHERDARPLVERLGAPVYAPPPDTEDDLMEKYGATREQAAGGSPDLRWLVAGDIGEGRLYAAGDRLPVGIEAFPGREHNDLVLWIESRGAVIAGDTLVDFGSGLEIPDEWLREAVSRDEVATGLRPLLSLPVELVLPVHGSPTDAEALRRALE